MFLTLAILSIIGLTVLSPSDAVATEVIVVVQSNTDRYSVGETLDSQTVIELEEGDQLKVASSSGVLCMRGRYTGPATNKCTDDEQSISDALRELLGKTRPDTTGLGAIRATPADEKHACEVLPPTAWSLVVTDGEQCVRAGGTVSFWRHDAAQSTALTVKRLSVNTQATLPWPANENSITWPESPKIVDGEMYLIRYADRIQSKSITINEIPAGINTEVQAIAWMSTHSCKCQAEILFRDSR